MLCGRGCTLMKGQESSETLSDDGRWGSCFGEHADSSWKVPGPAIPSQGHTHKKQNRSAGSLKGRNNPSAHPSVNKQAACPSTQGNVSY